MSYLKQFLIYQGKSALQMVVAEFGGKYFSPAEMGAFQVAIDALTDLPARVKRGK